ncbi:MAG: methionyl-tRNA formyltransferase [Planctomycetaceae bacterium]|nr:methionyl-tRNA formyltransferase [Planctomycetaceae bacterium]
MKIVLMGTGEFALPPFRALMESEHIVTGLLTQPDKTGRGHHRHVNKVKELALERSIPVLQPERVNKPDVLEQLQAFDADLFVVAAYGQILRPQLLAIPRMGAFNLHGSLLPRHRGAAPVQYSIWCGDQVTGVTMFQIEPALDSGPVIGKVQTPIHPEETSGDLMMRLASLSIPLTLDCCNQLEAGRAVFEPQNDALVTLSPRITKQQAVIDWNQTARQIDCLVRAMQPWPKASTWLQIEGAAAPVRCIVLRAKPILPDDSERTLGTGTFGVPGEIKVVQGRLLVACLEGVSEIHRIQPEGRRAMDAGDFINGYSLQSGSRFVGSPEETG